MSEEINQEKINKARKETEKDLKEDGAKKVRNRNEKGRFTEGSRLEVTSEQIEKAKKEMEEALKPLEQEIKENKKKIKDLEQEYIEKGYPDKIEERIIRLEEKIKDKEKRKRIESLKKKREELIKDLDQLEQESDPKGVRMRSNEEIEKEALKVEKDIKDIEEKKKNLTKTGRARLKKEKKEFSMKDIENMSVDRESIKSQAEVSDEFLDYMDQEEKDEGESDSPLSPEMKAQKERMKEFEKETDEILEEDKSETKEESDKEESEVEKDEKKGADEEEEREEGKKGEIFENLYEKWERLEKQMYKSGLSEFQKTRKREIEEEMIEIYVEDTITKSTDKEKWKKERREWTERSRGLLRSLYEEFSEEINDRLKEEWDDYEKKRDGEKETKEEEVESKKEEEKKKEEETDAEDREEDQEKETPEKKIKKLAQKIVNEENPEFNDEERQLQENYSEELEKELKNLTEEEDGEDDPSSEEQQEAVPENLAQFLEKETFGEDNKSILKGKWGRRVRHLAAGVGGAKALKAIIEKVPGITVPSGACSIAGGFVGGAITGVGLKLGHFGVEKWKETQNHANFSEGLESELEGMSKEESIENIEFNMAKLNTNAEILDKRIKELKGEKERIKQEEGFFWFLKEEGRDINNIIKEHEKTLEKTEDQFRYLSVELKDKEDNLNVEELADRLMDMKVEQLKEKIEKGGPHADLLKAILISIEGSEEKIGSKTKQKSETMKAVEKSAVGLIAKLEQEGTTMTKEILKSAAFAGVIGGIAGFVTGSEIFEDKLESIKELFDSGAPEAEIESEIDGITGLMQEEVMEVADEAAGLEISYAIESSDSVWSVTEEFLYDNIAEFESLTEAEKTYVIDHITTTIESNPDAFGLELAEGETIDNLLADKHNINFAPLLDGQLEEALRQAESLSTEEVANILENNEKIRAFLSDHPNTRIDGNTIKEILSETSEELTEEKITEELIIDGFKSESSTSAEQLANIENWLERMKNGELTEASFDFMADTSEGGRRELWVEQLAKIEGVSQSEMEYMLEESYSEINGREMVSSVSEEVAEEASQINEKASWVESLEEKFQKVKVGDANPEELESLLEEAPEDQIYEDNYFQDSMAEIYEEKLSNLENVESGEVISETAAETYRFEGSITRTDRWQLFQSFTAEFGEEILIESDVTELLEEGEITPEEFVNWIEDGAFDKRLDFGGELPPKKRYVEQLKVTLRLLEEADSQHVYLGARDMVKKQIDRFILFGKQ